MSCGVLYIIFGRDTRPTQVINVVVSIFWAIALALHTYGYMQVELPQQVESYSVALLQIVIAAVFFGVIGLVTRGRPHQLFKSFGLVLGALTQAILANGYVSQFPPLDMQMVICAGLSVWYLLAVFYVFRCEGINE